MNNWQVARQIRYLLRARRWQGGSSSDGFEHVFQAPSVRVSPIASAEMVSSKALPLCLINGGNENADPMAGQEQRIVKSDFEITVAALQTGEEAGENAIIGANRPNSYKSSKGRGLLEIKEEILAVLGYIGQTNGISVQGFYSSAIAATLVEGLGYVAQETHTFAFFLTTYRTYEKVTALVGSGATGGTISLSWKAAPDRWDRVSGSGGQVIKYAAGAVAPATFDAGLAGPTVSGTATSATISGLSSGTYSISIFSGYNEAGGTVPERYSDPVSVLSIVVP